MPFPARGTLIADRRQVGEPIDGKLITEASDIRVPIGRWPETIILDGDPDSIGRAREGFSLSHADVDDDGEVQSVTYRSAAGVMLRVFND